MRTTQPPITNDRELAGYWASAEHLRGVMERYEADVLAERQKEPADLERLDSASTRCAISCTTSMATTRVSKTPSRRISDGHRAVTERLVQVPPLLIGVDALYPMLTS
jgi:hypothetical protein